MFLFFGWALFGQVFGNQAIQKLESINALGKVIPNVTLVTHANNNAEKGTEYMSTITAKDETQSVKNQSGGRFKQTQSASTSGGPKTGAATSYRAWVAKGAKQPMVLEAFDAGPLGAEEVEVAVEHCGLCHSDLSVLNNEWGISQYPAILGHEVIGRVTAAGPNVKGVEVGQRVGVGWNSGSCMHCHQCMSGNHHLCPEAQSTIIGHRGGFATPGPLALGMGDAAAGEAELRRRRAAAVRRDHGVLSAGDARQADRPRRNHRHRRAGALGGEVRRRVRLRGDGIHVERKQVRGSEGIRGEPRRLHWDSAAIKKLAGNFDLLISTVNVRLDWDALIGTLAPNGRLHVVGAVLEPIPVAAFALIEKQRSVSGSPSGSPVAIETMLDFASRHNIAPQTEHFPMSEINEAFARLESGKAHYRIVLDADF